MSTRFVYLPLALLAVIPAAAQTSPALTAVPVSVAFTWVQGAALPAAQSVSVKAGSGILAFTTVVAPMGTQWITITPGNGTLPASLSVLVNPSGLPVGSYAAAIELTAAGFTNPLAIPVSLTVEAPLPTLSVSAPSLSFSTPSNPPPAQTLTLTAESGPVTFSAAVQSASWLTVTPASGVALPGLPMTLTVAVNAAGLAPSAVPYSGKISIVASGVPTANKTQTVTVSMTVNALTPTITSLYPSAALAGSGPLTITITGTGFYKGGTTATAASTPLTATFVNPTTLTAVLPASVLAAPGTVNVSVVNPAPGGVSAPAAFIVSATPVIQAIVSAASYAAGPVAPGELVTLFGTGIGPAAAAGMSIVAGYATSTLNGVSVAIDGQSAAMIYSSANQITVQVPYTVTIATARPVVLNNNGVVALGTVDTAPTAPGLFLISGVLGQCAALTYSMKSGSFSVNGTTSPALAGDIMVFYLTGEGIYDLTASPATGFVIPATLNPLPQLNPLPLVTIGGVAATVQYAGPVVGGLLGVLQINAVVPAGSTTGNSVPVAISIGAGVTQPGATIVVK